MEKLISRNNTSFLKNLRETINTIFPKESLQTDPLKYHQRIVHDYLLKYPQIRGVLAYFEMGAGKTILAASIVDSFISKSNSTIQKILFISSKTLHGNFREDYKKYLGMIKKPIDNMDNYIDEHCEFITLTANNMLQQIYKAIGMDDSIMDELLMSEVEGLDLKKLKDELNKHKTGNLDNTFIVIDEAHNFFNGITNGSKNYVGLYQLIMSAKNIKILFLTGSPITNDPFEIALCFNMLNGYFPVEKNIGKNKKDIDLLTLFGEEYDDFRKYFISYPESTDVESNVKDQNNKVYIPIIKNREKFANRIIGLVSYYGTDQQEIQKLFPKLEETIIQRVPMSTLQYAAYAAARDKEQEETKRGLFRAQKKTLQKPGGMSSSYRVRSRQISNFLYPKYASKTFKDERGFSKYEKYIDQLKPHVFDIKSIKKGKAEIDNEDDLGLDTWSPKLVQMLVNLSIHLPIGMLDDFKKLSILDKWKPELLKQKLKPGIGPGIVYSQFIDSGIGLLGKILSYHGMKEIKELRDLKNIDEYKNGTYTIISGEVSPELRTELIKLAISSDNKQGKLLSVLLITATGAEGISTKYMRHVHAMEPFWHYSRLSQVFARAARLGSHVDLPEEDRTVQPYIYLSDYPLVFEDKEQMKIKSVEDTTDITLYYKAIQNQILIDSFLNVLKESSFTCSTFYDKLNCMVCAPTNRELFVPNIDKDMITPNPCQKMTEEKIVAKSVILEDNNGKREYMYTLDAATNELHIFLHNPQLNAYSEIFEDHPDYFELYEKITKKLVKSK